MKVEGAVLGSPSLIVLNMMVSGRKATLNSPPHPELMSCVKVQDDSCFKMASDESHFNVS